MDKKKTRLCAQTMRAHVGVSGSGRWCSHRTMPRNHGCCHWRPRHALSPSNHVQSTIMNFPLLVPILILLSGCINSSVVFTLSVGYSRPPSAVNDPSVTKYIVFMKVLSRRIFPNTAINKSLRSFNLGASPS